MPRRVLVIDDRVPVEGIGGGYGRMRSMVLELAREGWAVSVLPTSVSTTLPPDDFVGAGVRCVDESLAEHLARQETWYDVVVASRPGNFALAEPLVRSHQPWARLVYDCEALFWRRMERQARLIDDPSTAERLRDTAVSMRQIEERNARAADLTICLSDEEAQLLRGDDAGPRVCVIPPVDANVSPHPARFRARRHVGFVAGWLAGPASPNADALRWFAAEILPAVRRQLPWVKVRVTGADPPVELLPMAGPNLAFEGYVSDLAAFYASIRVAVAPIRFGAGVKIKTVEAMQHGVPTVSTTIGAEGILPSPPAGVIVSDDPSGFARAVIQLLTDEDEWEGRRIALEHVNESWSSNRTGASVVSVLRRLCDG
jgi:glycosyltransferase involved in cell wall biosynthesis